MQDIGHADDEIELGELDDNESERRTAVIIEDHVDCDLTQRRKRRPVTRRDTHKSRQLDR